MSVQQIRIRCPEKLACFAKPKRTKIAVGGRGGAKSITFADFMVAYMAAGEKVLCGREFQNSIDESVHSLLGQRIGDLGVDGFDVQAKGIYTNTGGSAVYRGLARNVESIKSVHGVKRAWIEEGQTLSQYTIDTVFPTIREDGSEIWISMNRGSSSDPVSQSFLLPYEEQIRAEGYYEDDELLIVEINYWDNPFFPEVLERQRIADKKRMSAARYDHIWRGYYSDSVEDAIIAPEWFDACVDANEKLGFKERGSKVVSFDPADRGTDPKGLIFRHGPILLEAKQRTDGDVNEACDWSIDFARQRGAEIYVWDADGMGTGLRRQVSEAFDGSTTEIVPFHGGTKAERPDDYYQPVHTQIEQRTNLQTFYNRRAQHYWLLRDRMERTYNAVHHGEYHDPDTLFSISSQCEALQTLRSELCRVPQKYNASNRLQVMTKKEMRSPPLNIPSPNVGDAVMMSMAAQWVTTFTNKRRPRRRAPPNWRV